VNLGKIFNIKCINLKYRTIPKIVNAKLLTQYMAGELLRGFRVNFIMKQLAFGLKSLPYVVGYKVCFAGRFSKRQMALYKCKNIGLLSLNSIDSMIDYNSVEFVSQYGMCGVKLWLQFSRKKLRGFNFRDSKKERRSLEKRKKKKKN